MKVELADANAENWFFRDVENEVNEYIRDKVFWTGENKSKKFDGYNTVWEYLAEWVMTLQYPDDSGIAVYKEEEAQTYICHKCCRTDIQTEEERQKYDPLCQKCYEEEERCENCGKEH